MLIKIPVASLHNGTDEGAVYANSGNKPTPPYARKNAPVLSMLVSEIGLGSPREIITALLKPDPKIAYTIQGILVKGWKLSDAEIKEGGKKFYRANSGTSLCLKRMMKEGLIERRKDKTRYMYWWKQ